MSGLTFCNIHTYICIYIFIFCVRNGWRGAVTGWLYPLGDEEEIYMYLYMYAHYNSYQHLPLHRYGQCDPMRTTTRQTVFAVSGTRAQGIGRDTGWTTVKAHSFLDRDKHRQEAPVHTQGTDGRGRCKLRRESKPN